MLALFNLGGGEIILILALLLILVVWVVVIAVVIFMVLRGNKQEPKISPGAMPPRIIPLAKL